MCIGFDVSGKLSLNMCVQRTYLSAAILYVLVSVCALVFHYGTNLMSEQNTKMGRWQEEKENSKHIENLKESYLLFRQKNERTKYLKQECMFEFCAR